MIAYSATKKVFLKDAPEIQDVVAERVRNSLGFRPSESEKRAWQSSIGNAMFHVLNDQTIPDDLGVAIEYQIKSSEKRVDMILTGENVQGRSRALVIELKQWSEVLPSYLDDFLEVTYGSGRSQEAHPSYQALSYKHQFEDFYVATREIPIEVLSCSYMHNCTDEKLLRSNVFASLVQSSPVFLKPDRQHLREYIKELLPVGDKTQTLERLESSEISPSKNLADSLVSMLKGNSEFWLLDKQKRAYEEVRAAVRRQPGERKKQVIIIDGGPGTGKSVIAIKLLVDLISSGSNARYATKNLAPRSVYESKLAGKLSKRDISALFIGTSRLWANQPGALDVLLVDEAHRMEKADRYSSTNGADQVMEAIRASNVTVFFIDEKQNVTWKDHGSKSVIRYWAEQLGAEVTECELTSQYRCTGAVEYLNKVDQLLEIQNEGASDFSATDFEVRVFDTVDSMYEEILKRNSSRNKARVVAGYCWNWISKRDNSKWDLTFPNSDLKLQWNLRSKYGYRWMIDPESVTEVGCIHTAQGLELDYIGVIIGPDLVARNGSLVAIPEARAKTDESMVGFGVALKANPDLAKAKADQIIRNTYRTLLTRGAKGCFIYCTDPETAEYFRKNLKEQTK